MIARKPKPEPPEEDEDGEQQVITVDGKNKTVSFELTGQNGLVLLKAIAFFVIVSSIAILLYCLAYLLDVIGKNFFEPIGLILWALSLSTSVFWSHWPR